MFRLLPANGVAAPPLRQTGRTAGKLHGDGHEG